MSLTNPNTVVTEERLSEFYQQILPFLGGASHALVGGAQPIGSIIPFMGTVAPSGTLACDGTVYNIADYPDLANFFDAQFGQINKFGGDGTTTFAVPDLRGEFLRGTGTNSHENQGNGANVGIHQDATAIPKSYTNVGGTEMNMIANTTVQSKEANIDSDYTLGSTTLKWAHITSTANATGNTKDLFTSRPTNTSVLWCIQAVAENTYSTEEQIVATWIDGKPLYQKTIIDTLPVTTTKNTVVYKDIEQPSNLNIISITGVLNNDVSTVMFPCYFGDGSGVNFTAAYRNEAHLLRLSNANPDNNNKTVYITIQYTKTS